jgi:hypothetical protein
MVSGYLIVGHRREHWSMARITKQAWFGPKTHLGWGWTVKSWQGAVASAVVVGLIVLAVVVLNGTLRWIVEAALLTAFLILVLLTGDPPGGPHLPTGGRG